MLIRTPGMCCCGNNTLVKRYADDIQWCFTALSRCSEVQLRPRTATASEFEGRCRMFIQKLANNSIQLSGTQTQNENNAFIYYLCHFFPQKPGSTFIKDGREAKCAASGALRQERWTQRHVQWHLKNLNTKPVQSPTCGGAFEHLSSVTRLFEDGPVVVLVDDGDHQNRRAFHQISREVGGGDLQLCKSKT